MWAAFASKSVNVSLPAFQTSAQYAIRHKRNSRHRPCGHIRGSRCREPDVALRQAAVAAFGKPVDQMSVNADRTAAGRLEHVCGCFRQQLRRIFPSLKRRLKRLDRMGAHVEIQSSASS
jgi:hypothetical protein